MIFIRLFLTGWLAISGRYEFHNKGMDLALDALADVAAARGRRVVLFVLVPAGNSGMGASRTCSGSRLWSRRTVSTSGGSGTRR